MNVCRKTATRYKMALPIVGRLCLKIYSKRIENIKYDKNEVAKMKTGMRRIVQPIVEVVDFERTNKVPAIEGLKECRREIMQGYQNVWYEYVPKSYNERKKFRW